MTSLVTGAAGFAGRHLCRLLHRNGESVHAMVSPLGNGGPVDGAAEVFVVDLLDFPGLSKRIAESQPEVIYHLAAVSSSKHSWNSRRQTHETNYLGTLNLLESVLESGQGPRLVLIGSASAYGAVPDSRQPITENEPFAPRDPYGVSKAAAELLGRQYGLAHGMDVVLMRPFNHTGPGQGPGFVCADLAHQIAAIEAGRLEPVLHVGNLEAKRDFSDARDVVEAYRLAALYGRGGEAYNVGSGRAWSVAAILERLVELAAVSIEVRVDPEKLRPLDNPLVIGNASKLRGETGWQPQRDFFRETLVDLLDDWRRRTAAD